MKLAVVIPSIREDCFRKWAAEWEEDFRETRVILVEDNPEKTFRAPSWVEHYAWQDTVREMGGDSWIIPRRADAVCSFGFLKALQGDADVIWNLNDDCYPEEAHKGAYLQRAAAAFTSVPDDSWHNTITGLYPRGYPYGIRGRMRPVVFHHGLWSNIPDLDGETQLANPDFRLPPCQSAEVVPPGKFFPMCNMNMMFRRDIAPVMYQLLMGSDQNGTPWGFDRFADIWSGLLMKKTADHLGLAVTSGTPGIRHSRASDPHRNVQLEAAGRSAHEKFWELIRDTKLTESTPAGCYPELADALDCYREPTPRAYYWHSLAAAMRVWVKWAR